MADNNTAIDALHRESIIIDTHCDTLGRVYEGQRRLGERSTLGQFDLPRAIAGGLTAEFMATFVDDRRPGDGIRQSLHFIDVYYQELEAFAACALQALCTDDIRRAKATGKVALLLSMEGAEGLGGDLRALRMFYRLGLRSLGLTWNRRNEAADGTGEVRTGGGLSNFGVSLVKECNRLGILLDMAHLSPAGVQDVLELSDAPVVVTHANCYALWPHPRNLTDEQLEAVARKGGVVGVTPVPLFLGENQQRNQLSVLLDHLDHMVQVMGVAHVGIGMDFDGVGDSRVEGIEDISQLANVTRGLVARGYSPDDIAGMLGGNFLRVLAEVIH
jgi:membrane dipeptidase